MEKIFNKILVEVNASSTGLIATEITAEIAQKFCSKVTIIHVISHEFMHPELRALMEVPDNVIREMDEVYGETGKKIIRSAEEFFKEKSIANTSELVKAEDPAEKILQISEKNGYDLLVTGNVPENKTNRFCLGSVAEKLSLYAKSPVLIAKRKTAFKKLLVATDGSSKASKAVDYAIQLCQSFDAKMTLLNAEEKSLLRFKPKEAKKISEHILNAATEKAKGVTFYPRMEIGDPATAILKVARQEDSDIIVLGSRGISSIKRFLLGSVSSEVSIKAQCSVLIIR